MKVSELRIGNIVSVNDEVKTRLEEEDYLINIFEVDELKGDGDISVYNKIENLYEFLNIDEIEPIELTEYWLLKAGFSAKEYKSGYIGKDFASGQMTLSFVLCNQFAKGDWNDCYTFDLRDSMFKSLRYVHELQNLYFLLTNSELQFVS